LDFRVRNIVIMLVLAVLAVATGLTSWQRQTAPTAPAVASVARPLGYYVRDARIVGTDAQGRVSYRIYAEKLDELPDEQRLRLEGVSLEYRPVDEAAWDISARSANAPKDHSELELEGDVELRSAPADGSAPVVISTQQLRFSPGTSRAETDEPVAVHVGDWRLAAVGLRTDLKDHTLELESQVHGTFSR
jgi:LPS export ABC transporter protein LptC